MIPLFDIYFPCSCILGMSISIKYNSLKGFKEFIGFILYLFLTGMQRLYL